MGDRGHLPPCCWVHRLQTCQSSRHEERPRLAALILRPAMGRHTARAAPTCRPQDGVGSPGPLGGADPAGLARFAAAAKRVSVGALLRPPRWSPDGPAPVQCPSAPTPPTPSLTHPRRCQPRVASALRCLAARSESGSSQARKAKFCPFSGSVLVLFTRRMLCGCWQPSETGRAL